MNNLIICAANKITVTKPCGETTNIIVADSGHFQSNMLEIFRLLRELGCDLSSEQLCEGRSWSRISRFFW